MRKKKLKQRNKDKYEKDANFKIAKKKIKFNK